MAKKKVNEDKFVGDDEEVLATLDLLTTGHGEDTGGPDIDVVATGELYVPPTETVP